MIGCQLLCIFKENALLLVALETMRRRCRTCCYEMDKIISFPQVWIALHDGVVAHLEIPADSIPRRDGWKRASGHRNRSLPMVIVSTSALVAASMNETRALSDCQKAYNSYPS